MKEEEFEKQWSHIEQNFDFAKAHKVVKDLNWHWLLGYHNGNTPQLDVPTLEYFIRIAKTLLRKLWDNQNKYQSLKEDGFFVFIENGKLHLWFVVEKI